jgi:hypothetical protein
MLENNIAFPVYKYDKKLKIFREHHIPPPELFMPLGFNPNHEMKQKHYRKYYEDELENVPTVMEKSPFNEYIIYTGQSRGLDESIFFKDDYDDAGQVSNLHEVGKFKGIVTVENVNETQIYKDIKKTSISILKEAINELSEKILEEPFDFNYGELETCEGREEFEAKLKKLGCSDLNITRHFTQMNYNEQLTRTMLKVTKCIVRVYIIEAYDLAKRDNGSHSDPYIIMKINDEKIDERDNYQNNEPNPSFHTHYDFEGYFPGCSPLRLQFWDYDKVFGDDLIGETIVDLEDRFFSAQWQSIKNKPIEYRQLYHPSSKVSQGVVKMWVEIHPHELRQEKGTIWNIQPRPPKDFEVRVVIWDTQDIKTYDWEGTSDIYIRTFFDSNKSHLETDTHYRCQNGKGSFNYRLKFDISNPGEFHILNIQVWDVDIFSSNDFIADTAINLALPIQDATETGKPIKINKKYAENFLEKYMEGK